MNCWSCQKEMPDNARFCPHCEAQAEREVTGEEEAGIASALAGLSPDLLSEFRDALEQSANGEEFVNRVMVGDCPTCASSNTGDCEKVPELEDPCLGRCFDCGQFWCLDCGELYTDAAQSIDHDCPAWADMDWDEPGLDDDSDDTD